MRGGYIIIDLNNVNFATGVEKVVEGIYERIGSTKKPVRLCNVKIEGIEKRDVDLVNLCVNGSGYFAYTTYVDTDISTTISDTNGVTFRISE